MTINQDETLELIGWIVRRRCLGKNLSFLDLRPNLQSDNAYLPIDDKSSTFCQLINEESNPEDWKLIFRRSNFDGDNFPIKPSDLPHGAHISVKVLKKPDPENLWQVVAWSMLEEHPKAKALRLAKEGEGISYSIYLQSRAESYFYQKESGKLQEKLDENVQDVSGAHTLCDTSSAKGHRAKVFANWLMENLFCITEAHEKILDVAGGKGQLSIALAKFGLTCTVMDPMIRKTKKRVNANNPEYLHLPFTKSPEMSKMVEEYTCLIGLHPDECTEDILDMALLMKKKVAIIPCCVFPSLFPCRTLPDGRSVQTFDDFLMYLLSKDDRLRISTLPFQGKNKVIYLIP